MAPIGTAPGGTAATVGTARGTTLGLTHGTILGLLAPTAGTHLIIMGGIHLIIMAGIHLTITAGIHLGTTEAGMAVGVTPIPSMPTMAAPAASIMDILQEVRAALSVPPTVEPTLLPMALSAVREA